MNKNKLIFLLSTVILIFAGKVYSDTDTHYDTLSSTGDYRAYSKTVNYPGNISVSLSGVPAGCDYDLYLYNNSETEVATSENGSNANESISYSNSSTGATTYSVKVLSYSGGSSSQYTLSITYPYDTIAPTGSIGQPKGWIKTQTFSVTCTGSDSESGLASRDIDISTDGATTWQDYSYATISGYPSTDNYTFSYTGQEGKEYRFRVKYTDRVSLDSGWNSDGTTKIDITLPQINVTGPVNQYQIDWDTITIYGSITDNIGLLQIVVKLNNETMINLPLSLGTTFFQLTNKSEITDMKLRQGINEIYIYALDHASNPITTTLYVNYGIYISTHFKFHFNTYTDTRAHNTTSGLENVDSYGWDTSVIHPGIPDYVYDFGEYFENSWNIETGKPVGTNKYGYDEPPCRENRYPDYPIDPNYYHVYMTSLPYYNDGKTSVFGNGYSFITIDNDMALNVTAAHELFHGCQASYNPSGDRWWKEATAVWMSNEVYPINNYDYTKYLYYSGPQGQRSWFQPPYDISGSSLTYVDGWHEYGSVIFAKYLSKKFSDKDIIRRVWESCRSADSITSIENELIINSTDLKQSFKDFSIWNYDIAKYNESLLTMPITTDWTTYGHSKTNEPLQPLYSKYFEIESYDLKPKKLIARVEKTTLYPNNWGVSVLAKGQSGIITQLPDITLSSTDTV